MSTGTDRGTRKHADAEMTLLLLLRDNGYKRNPDPGALSAAIDSWISTAVINSFSIGMESGRSLSTYSSNAVPGLHTRAAIEICQRIEKGHNFAVILDAIREIASKEFHLQL